MGHGFIDGAMGDLFLADEAEAGVDEQHSDSLVRQVAHASTGELIDELGGAQGLLDEALALGAVTDFESGGQESGFGRAEGFFGAQELGGEAGELAEAAVGFDEALGDLDGVLTGDAGIDEKREQLGVRESGGPEAEETLTRAVVHGEVRDAVGRRR
jgi:hypothetical protein